MFDGGAGCLMAGQEKGPRRGGVGVRPFGAGGEVGQTRAGCLGGPTKWGSAARAMRRPADRRAQEPRGVGAFDSARRKSGLEMPI